MNGQVFQSFRKRSVRLKFATAGLCFVTVLCAFSIVDVYNSMYFDFFQWFFVGFVFTGYVSLTAVSWYATMQAVRKEQAKAVENFELKVNPAVLLADIEDSKRSQEEIIDDLQRAYYQAIHSHDWLEAISLATTLEDYYASVNADEAGSWHASRKLIETKVEAMRQAEADRAIRAQQRLQRNN